VSDFFKDLIIAVIPPSILSLAAWREARAARKHAAENLKLLKRNARLMEELRRKKRL